MQELKVVYVDLDGTLLGRNGSLLHDSLGNFSRASIKGLEACSRADVEVVIKSGRRYMQVQAAARLLGQSSYICEVGALLIDDGEEVWLAGDWKPTDERNIFEQIGETGAPELLLETYAGKLEHHTPWHLNRDVSYLLRGEIDLEEANELIRQKCHPDLKLIDNGFSNRHSDSLQLDRPSIYHLLPTAVSKANAVACHMRRREYTPEQCIAVGDSVEDLAVADVVGRFFLVANAIEKDPDLEREAVAKGNVEITEGKMGDGFYEAVVQTLAERH